MFNAASHLRNLLQRQFMMAPENSCLRGLGQTRLLKSLFAVRQALRERIKLNNVNTSSVRPEPVGELRVVQQPVYCRISKNHATNDSRRIPGLGCSYRHQIYLPPGVFF